MEEPPFPEPQVPVERSEAEVPRAVVLEAPVDRKRDAGLRGEELATATIVLAIVFLTGIAVLVAVLLTRKKPG